MNLAPVSPTRQRQFEFAATYPAKRCQLPFFAHKFIRFMYRRGLATFLHRDCLILLTLIVLTEDQVRYSRPVGFWQSELTAMTGMNGARLDQMTKLCVQAGWLAHCSGAKGVQSTYFVLVPGGDAVAMADAPLGQDHDNSLSVGMQATPPAPAVASNVTMTTLPAVSDIALDDRYQPLLALLERCGVRGKASCLRTALQWIDSEQIAAVLHYHLARRIVTAEGELFPYDGGAVVTRLTNPDYARLPPAEGWPKQTNPAWKKLDTKARRNREAQHRADKLNAERDNREARQLAERTAAQQLELQFGPLIDALTQTAPERLWQLIKQANQYLHDWGRDTDQNPAGLKSKVIRPLLLKAAASGVFKTEG